MPLLSQLPVAVRRSSDEEKGADVTATHRPLTKILKETAMQARMNNPAGLLPEAAKAVNILYKESHSAGVPGSTLELVHLRASQINGCSACVDSGARSAKKNGETDERLFAVAVWRETPYFTDAERAALELTEAATRLADRSDPVPDGVWDDAADHYDEKELAGLVLSIAAINAWNRINATTRQIAGAAWR
jgi:AhpD family alkylhydroperoxidase